MNRYSFTVLYLFLWAFCSAFVCLWMVYTDQVLSNKSVDSLDHKSKIPISVTPHSLTPTKMSEFDETDSIKGGYFIGVLRTKDGKFKNVKYPAEIFVLKEHNIILQEVTLQLAHRVDVLEANHK